MDEKKVIANVTNVSSKDLIFYVLNPMVNDQPYFKDDLANATYTTQQGEDTEWSSEPFRNRDLKNPYYINDKFPQGYVSGTENFYPMKLKVGETKNGLPMIKEHLDGMVTRGLVTYTVSTTRNFAIVQAVNSDVAIHGELIAKGKTKSVELTDAVQELITAGELAIV